MTQRNGPAKRVTAGGQIIDYAETVLREAAKSKRALTSAEIDALTGELAALRKAAAASCENFRIETRSSACWRARS